ncbi:hypothetical protein Mlute_01510 [Meiothermus luteus]|uniref:Uncharacterized protein n=1 Tax=Meiothermus luteus TaxID=2026184 RepID=A0A399EM61_9DEIN|nr:hypothetical protein Mlute_01510 [Meiothermus luteus]
MAEEKGRRAFLAALARVLKERSWLPLRPQKVEIQDALRLQKSPPLYLTLLGLQNHTSTTAFLPVRVGPVREEAPGLFARSRPQEGYFYELSQDLGFYSFLLKRLKGGLEARSLRAYYRGHHPGPVPESLELLRPGLAAGEGVWLQVGLVQDGGLDRSLRLLPKLGLPWVLVPEGRLVWERGVEKRVLALTGRLPEGRPQEAFALAQALAWEGMSRLQAHGTEGPGLGLLAEALKELEAMARLLGVRLALLHRALAEVEGGSGEGVFLLNRGLGAFLVVEGELCLVALGPQAPGAPVEDLVRVAYDLERAVELAWEGLEGAASELPGMVAEFLGEALRTAYQETAQKAISEAGWVEAMARCAKDQLEREERPARLRIYERWQKRIPPA